MQIYFLIRESLMTVNYPPYQRTRLYTGRVALRALRRFKIQIRPEIIQGISYKYCKVIQRSDGCGYSLKARQP